MASLVARTMVFACAEKQKGFSKATRAREEVISPFRTFRMFVYPALMASGCIAGLTSLPRLVAAVSSSSTAVVETAQGLGIDVAAVVVFALLYQSDLKSRDLSLAKLGREESLSQLKVELANKRVLSLGQMRGIARFVIVAGPRSYVREALQRSKPYQKDLVERGITVVSLVTKEDDVVVVDDSEKDPVQWKATPIYTAEWSRWIDEQKQLAKIPGDSPVYLSLRLDGRVRGSGVGLPPWAAFVAQVPPLKGIWRGALDGMDGRV